MSVVLVYITCAGREEARAIAQELVTARLAACVNILPEIESFFHWEGRLEQARETALVAKTVTAKVPDLVAAVRKKHSYSVPAILVLPVVDGFPLFLDWVRSEVAD
jgi:periplasmic divalent cation tolerance protein